LDFYPGMRFGRLVLRQKTRENPKLHPNMRKQYVVDCACGKRVTVPAIYLIRSPNPKVNCGQCVDLKTTKTTYNQEYRIWLMMLVRTTDPRHKHFKHYGGRGIRVCDEWADPVTGFDSFLNHIGPRPSERHTVDRIDNNQGYQPYHEGKPQVRWATAQEQAANRRKSNT